VKILTGTVLALALGALSGCGGSSSSSSTNNNATNWQFTMVQEQPRPAANFTVTGFIKQDSKGALTGSLLVPPSPQKGTCAGSASATGTTSSGNFSLDINSGGNIITLTGTTSSDGTIQGSYSGPGGGCYNSPTNGTFTASQVPSITGNFTGELTSSAYMAILTGVNPANPVMVTGNLTQGPNDGSVNVATVTGTINAHNYPCFSTATVTGTVTGPNVYLFVFGFDGTQIGTIGLPGSPSSQGTPAVVTVTSGATSLVGSGPGTSGLALGRGTGQPFGPCPPLQTGTGAVPYDTAAINFNIQ
jgi:hypothetical protein